MKTTYFNVYGKPINQRSVWTSLKTIFLLLCVSFNSAYAQASDLSQGLTISCKNETLEKVINLIEQQSTYLFVLNDKVNIKHKVSIKVKNENINAILNKLFQGTNITYQVDGDNILVSIASPKVNSDGIRQSNIVKGKIVDNAGEPMIGVNVLVKGTTNGAITDFDGSYSLADVKETDVLVVTYIGYLTQEIKVGKRSVINIIMKDDTQALEEVVVVGYGVQKRSDVTGAISSFSKKDITQVPTSNVLRTMQGKVSGLDITQSSGQPGSDVQLTLRGNRSLKADNSPLILVDGIEYGSTVDINPTDIESMEILKDISSTAIYGTKGANGVIIITTKRGNFAQNTKLSFNSYVSIKNASAYPRMMNGREYGQLIREAYRTDNNGEYLDDAKIFGEEELYDINNDIWVDWHKELLHTAITQNYELNMSGGNEKTAFSASLGIQRDNGLMKNDNLMRYNGRLSLDHVINKIFKVGMSIMYTYKNQNKRYNALNMANKIVPVGKAYNEDGSIRLNPVPGNTSAYSPIADEVENAFKDEIRTKRMFASSYLQANILSGLTFKTSFGLDLQDLREGTYKGKYTLQNIGQKSTSSLDNKSVHRYTWENTLNYSKTLGKHGIQGLLGSSAIKYSNESSSMAGANQASETTGFHDMGSNTDSKEMSSSLKETQLLSFFGRINYKYNERYLLQLSLRADGSSVLADGNKWGYFPSVSVAWRISEENFVKNISFVDNLKLRLSWGVAGNSAIDAYSTLGGLSKGVYAFGNSGVYGYWPSDIPNKDLTWEKTATWNVGLDFSFFDNRLGGSVDAYIANTSNLLLPASLPASTGYTTVYQNVGKTRNKGVEINLNTVWFRKKDFNWETNWTYAKNHEEIVELNSGVTRNEASLWFVGSPAKVYYDYQKIGIWQLGEEEMAEKFGGFVPGQIKVKDANRNGSYDTDDRVVFSRVPKYSFGINNTFTFKNFDLTAFIYGRIGQYIKYEYNTLYTFNNETAAAVDYWTPENPTNEFPRPSKSGVYGVNKSSMQYVKGSFVKLKDVTIGYSLPKHIAKNLLLDNLRVYCTLSNYFTLYKSMKEDYDPEMAGSMAFPLTKQVLFGVNVDF